VQAYQTSQDVVPRGGIFLGKWRSSFAGSSDGKMNVQSACALNTRYFSTIDFSTSALLDSSGQYQRLGYTNPWYNIIHPSLLSYESTWLKTKG
jgi:hypothetical protein